MTGRKKNSKNTEQAKNQPRLLDAEEKRLWEAVKKTVTPAKVPDAQELQETLEAFLNEKPEVDVKSASKNKSKNTTVAQSKAQAGSSANPLSAYRALPQAEKSPDLKSGQFPTQPLDRRTRKAISQGKRKIDAKLDLHELTQAQAWNVLLGFIERAYREQKTTLLVITGKGKDGEGVLRRNVPLWLASAPFSSFISAISEASKAHGGAGALYVRLKKHSKK